MKNLNCLQYKISKPFKSWKNKYLKYITKKEADKHNLYNQVAREISEYTGESVEIVKQKHRLGPESDENYGIFKEQEKLSEEAVREFYVNHNYYLYELPLWNAEKNRPKFLSLITLPYLRHNKYRKVMDFGAGGGGFCIELAKNNLDVTYCDIGEQLFKFAKWRFEKRGLPVKMIKGLVDAREEFDCIFSFDAFEHIKDLPGKLKKLIGFIRFGGSLVFSGAFNGGTLHLEENEKYNDFAALDRLMQACGLTFQDRLAQFYFYKKLLTNKGLCDKNNTIRI